MWSRFATPGRKPSSTTWALATSLTPASGSQASARSFKIGRRVDHQDAGALARDAEHVLDPRGKEARFAGLHLEALAADLDVRRAFEEVAHLLDAGMQMRMRAAAALDLSDDDFQVVRIDQAIVARAAVVRRRVRLHVGLADQV